MCVCMYTCMDGLWWLRCVCVEVYECAYMCVWLHAHMHLFCAILCRCMCVTHCHTHVAHTCGVCMLYHVHACSVFNAYMLVCLWACVDVVYVCMHMYVVVNMNVVVYACQCLHAWLFVTVCIQVCVFIYMFAHMHTCVCSYLFYECMMACVRAWAHAHIVCSVIKMCAYTYAYMQPYTFHDHQLWMCTYTCIYIYIYTYTHNSAFMYSHTPIDACMHTPHMCIYIYI